MATKSRSRCRSRSNCSGAHARARWPVSSARCGRCSNSGRPTTPGLSSNVLRCEGQRRANASGSEICSSELSPPSGAAWSGRLTRTSNEWRSWACSGSSRRRDSTDTCRGACAPARKHGRTCHRQLPPRRYSRLPPRVHPLLRAPLCKLRSPPGLHRLALLAFKPRLLHWLSRSHLSLPSGSGRRRPLSQPPTMPLLPPLSISGQRRWYPLRARSRSGAGRPPSVAARVPLALPRNPPRVTTSLLR